LENPNVFEHADVPHFFIRIYMDRNQTQIFILLIAVVIFALMVGIISFLFHYRKKKIQQLRETEQLTKKHLQELLSKQLEMKQQTMEFIGAEIHDSVGQKLTLASLYTQQLHQRNSHVETGAQLQAISTILNESLAELRNLSKNLIDENRQNFSLEMFLQQECERINHSGLCSAQLSVTSNGHELQPQQKYVLLRIIQEFVQNSLKYSQCQNIRLSTMVTGNVFNLRAVDDGIGFDMRLTENSRKGIGLSNIRRRAESIGALLNLSSTIGSGTILELQVNI
jgi:signal transduction histidine kinase